MSTSTTTRSGYGRRSRRRYGPWHDVTTAVDGEVAQALGELARDRWKRATGEDLEPPPPVESAWPEGLEPSFRDVDVAISRTVPEHEGQGGVHEIEALYLAAIAAARRTIYIESQYFASRKIAEAMAARLREPDGPEIVVINPETADGWLEEEVMGSSRARLLRLVREADRHDRFRLYTPVTAVGSRSTCMPRSWSSTTGCSRSGPRTSTTGRSASTPNATCPSRRSPTPLGGIRPRSVHRGVAQRPRGRASWRRDRAPGAGDRARRRVADPRHRGPAVRRQIPGPVRAAGDERGGSVAAGGKPAAGPGAALQPLAQPSTRSAQLDPNNSMSEAGRLPGHHDDH